MKMVKLRNALIIALIAGCTSSGDHPDQQENKGKDAVETSADNITETIDAALINVDGEKIGSASLTEDETGVKIGINLRNLPSGTYAFHIHETGECNPPDFESAGGHFNPYDKEHGFLNPEGPHAGDLPNITVKHDGTIQEMITTKRVTLKKGESHSLLKPGGTALMIHSDADDYLTDPAGNAGDRIACGVITQN